MNKAQQLLKTISESESPMVTSEYKLPGRIGNLKKTVCENTQDVINVLNKLQNIVDYEDEDNETFGIYAQYADSILVSKYNKYFPKGTLVDDVVHIQNTNHAMYPRMSDLQYLLDDVIARNSKWEGVIIFTGANGPGSAAIFVKSDRGISLAKDL